MTAKPRFFFSPWFIIGVVFLVVGIVYAEVINFHFLPFWDDDTNIHRNPLYSPLTWGSIASFWEGPFQQLYIPVTYSVWGGLVALSRLFAGTNLEVGPVNSGIFHGANLVVHLFSTAMVFVILAKLLLPRDENEAARRKQLLICAIGALAFALHPVQVESVAWVSGLRDLLGGAFSLAALACYFASLEETENRFKQTALYLVASLLLLLAFGSKPGTVVVPALALLLGAWLLTSRGLSLKALCWLAPWFLLSLGEIVLTSKSQPAAELASSLVPVWARPLIACDAVAFYLGKLIFPFSLCADYGRAPNVVLASGLLWWTWVFPVALLICLTLVKKSRLYLIPFAVFVIGVLPTLGFIPFNFQVVSTVADHYLYLAMLGFALALTLLLRELPLRLVLVVSFVLLSFWSVLTLLQLPGWADGTTFFPATLSCNPTSWKSRHNYACTLDAQGKYPEALKEFQEAIRLRPSNANAYNDMALTLLKLNRSQEAIAAFQNSLQMLPTSGAARNLASVLLMLGRPSEAIQVYRFAIQIDPADLQNQRALAWVLATHPDDKVRNGKEALELARQIVIATNGQVPAFLFTLSVAFAEIGDFDQAASLASQAAQVFQNTGDPATAQLLHDHILPALVSHQTIRDNPVKIP
jgi:tetratricopeptide (TPR) repeat protein